jgi:hypothetical protein
MRTVSTIHKQAFVYISLLSLLALALVLSACGASQTGGAGSTGNTPTSAPTSAPTTAPTPVKGYGTSHGCPSDMVVSSAPTTANVVIRPANSTSTVTAHVGDVIEVRLPFGHKWGGPNSSPSNLQIQSPSGYAWTAGSACVWRFTATGTGSTVINFISQPLCKVGQMCPMYILNIAFKVDVK